MTERRWKVRRYEEGDEQGIVQLFEEIWEKPIGVSESAKLWEWQFQKNPFGDIYSMLGVDNGKIVGQFAFVPVPMMIHEDRTTGCLGLNVLVHPDYRGQQMFPILAEATYKLLAENDIALTYGFANANSIHGGVKYLGWKEIMTVPLMARPVNFEKAASMLLGSNVASKVLGRLAETYYKVRYKPLRMLSSLTISEIDSFSGEFDLLWDQVKDRLAISVIRDSRYLNWRFVDKPGYDYHIFCLRKGSDLLGYAVTYRQPFEKSPVTYIMDLLVKDFSQEYAGYLISHCTEKAQEAASDILCSMVCDSGMLAKTYRKLGFLAVRKERMPREIHFVVRWVSKDQESDILFDPRNWYVSLADTPGL